MIIIFRKKNNTFNDANYPIAPSKERHRVFPNNSVVGFRNLKSIKYHLVTALLVKIKNTLGSEPYGKKTGRSGNFL